MVKQSRRSVRGPSTSRSLADKFLLAIIDAYPTLGKKAGNKLAAKKERERRLVAAKKALFREMSGSGQPSLNDERALRWMAAQRLRDLTNKRFGRISASEDRSIRELARVAASNTYGNSKQAIVDRLRKKFASNEKHYLELEFYEDDVTATFEVQDLQSLKEPLRKIGINMNLEDLFTLIHG